MPWYLLMPFGSSVLFVIAMMLVKQASQRGVSPWTGTFLANIWLAMGWGVLAAVRRDIVGVEVWGQAAVVSLLFVLGQMFTYLAFQFGDVSVAAPVFGVKILIVAMLNALVTAHGISGSVWLGAVLATAGVILIQSRFAARQPAVTVSSGASDSEQNLNRTTVQHQFRLRLLTIAMALLAATCLSVFDLLLQTWGPRYDALAFLPAVFLSTGILSMILVPWVDRPAKLIRLGATRWITGGTLLMAVQAIGMCVALAAYGDSTRVNIVYALRGLWGVILTWWLARWLGGNEAILGSRVMLLRLAGALLLLTAVVTAML